MGQNKNSAMLHYLAWRVLCCLHKDITHSFPCRRIVVLVSKKRLRKTKVGSLAEIARVVEELAKVNTAQLCGTEDGQVIVPTYD